MRLALIGANMGQITRYLSGNGDQRDGVGRSETLYIAPGRPLCRAALILACVPIGCASPGPEDYASAASYYSDEAQKDDLLVQQHEDAIRVLVREGDQPGAEISREAADEARRRSRWERFQAAKDSWLSRWKVRPSMPLNLYPHPDGRRTVCGADSLIQLFCPSLSISPSDRPPRSHLNCAIASPRSYHSLRFC
jgi:hypothetical protein